PQAIPEILKETLHDSLIRSIRSTRSEYEGFTTRLRRLRSEARHRHAAVDVDDAAGGVGDVAAEERGDDPSHFLRLAPAAFRHQAFRDAAVVALAHGRRHVGGDDAGAYFVDGDAVFREAHGEQPRGHREPRLAHAVLAA